MHVCVLSLCGSICAPNNRLHNRDCSHKVYGVLIISAVSHAVLAGTRVYVRVRKRCTHDEIIFATASLSAPVQCIQLLSGVLYITL